MMVAPSILACDFSKLREEIASVDRCGVDMIHLDVMDGVFVPNLTFGPILVEAIRRLTTTPLDAHLMIVEPERYVDAFADAGADYIVFHIEATEKPEDCIGLIKKREKKAGIALRPSTDLARIRPFLSQIDLLLVMSVEPGFAGQGFITGSLDRIRRARQWIDETGVGCILAVDGGVKVENAPMIASSGADLLVAASAIFKARDYCQVIERLRCSKP